MKIFRILILILFSQIVAAQSGPGNCIIKYTYNATGDRIKRFQFCNALIQKSDNADIATIPPNEENSNELTSQQKPNDDLDIAVLFPNPTSSTCIVSLNKAVSNAMLTLYDNQGRVVHYERVSGKDLPLNLSGLSSGAYIVIVSTENMSVHKTVVKD